MTIKEVCSKFGISPDTLRYYERVGVIPEVHRTPGGIRDYTEEDIGWVETAACFRSAGMPIDLLAAYVRLYKEGDSTIPARCELLREARSRILAERQKCDDALAKMDAKIKVYEKAVQTGKLVWDDDQGCCSCGRTKKE
ncbi:MAG: MerR family transcriptional regulator [Oscillospiraceae bacterium]|nr:MerR family transcriptional regulator [Oscillospiraceae bacterium]